MDTSCEFLRGGTAVAWRRKPGTPGKTTIPLEIVSSVTERLSAAFTRHGYHRLFKLFVVSQQGYLYVEAEWRALRARTPRRRTKGSSARRMPLGRLRFLGTPDRWEYQPYRYSDEYWDNRSTEVGTPEELLLSMVLDGCR